MEIPCAIKHNPVPITFAKVSSKHLELRQKFLVRLGIVPPRLVEAALGSTLIRYDFAAKSPMDVFLQSWPECRMPLWYTTILLQISRWMSSYKASLSDTCYSYWVFPPVSHYIVEVFSTSQCTSQTRLDSMSCLFAQIRSHDADLNMLECCCKKCDCSLPHKSSLANPLTLFVKALNHGSNLNLIRFCCKFGDGSLPNGPRRSPKIMPSKEPVISIGFRMRTQV